MNLIALKLIRYDTFLIIILEYPLPRPTCSDAPKVVEDDRSQIQHHATSK
jgi:hypothetical protein